MSPSQSQCSCSLERRQDRAQPGAATGWPGRGQSPLNFRRFAGWWWLILACCWIAPLPARATDHAGFFFDRHELTLEAGSRTEAAGPFFYQQLTEQESLWAVPPLFSHSVLLAGDAEEYDLGYPLLTYDRFGGEYRWQFFQLLSFAGSRNQAEVARHRFTIFPIYFQQRSAETNQNYTALFPVYGQLKDRLFRSEMDFVLWPLYVKTVKRAGVTPLETFLKPAGAPLQPREGDLSTYNYLLPFFHLRYGDGLFGWQLWPLLGHEHKDITTQTNMWHDPEVVPGHDKTFVLWPFFLKQQRAIGSENPERELLVFPFYDRMRSPLRDATSYLTPLGLSITDDRGQKYREIGAPWPFVVFARGEGKTVNRLWPLFGEAHNASQSSDFYFWPAYSSKRVHGETLDRRRTRLLYFLGSHTLEKNLETGASKSRTDLWPLFSHRHEFNGNTRLQLLAPLEPILPASKSIERNYSPLWSLWVAENNPKTGERSQSLLWNLFRREVSPTTRKGSLLFGLFQYESGAEYKNWRLFYLPLKKSQKVSDHVPEHR